MQYTSDANVLGSSFLSYNAMFDEPAPSPGNTMVGLQKVQPTHLLNRSTADERIIAPTDFDKYRRHIDKNHCKLSLTK